MKTKFSFKQGKSHAKKNQLCQDYAGMYNNQLVSVIAVADGCSGAKFSREAAIINVEESISYFSNVKNWLKDSEEELIASLLDCIHARFQKSGLPIDELCATLCVVAVKADGEYMIVSIGDSTVIALEQHLEPLLLVEPFNGAKKSETLFTNDLESCLTYAQFRCNYLHAYHFSGFIIYTDGCERLFSRRLYQGGNLLKQISAHAVLDNDASHLQEMMNYTSNSYTEDDVSMAVVVMDNDSTIKDAKLLLNPTKQPEPKQVTDEFSKYPVMYRAILKALSENPMTPEEFVEKGYISYGKVLETLTPLVKDHTIYWENQKFHIST